MSKTTITLSSRRSDSDTKSTPIDSSDRKNHTSNKKSTINEKEWWHYDLPYSIMTEIIER